ncbi:PREDICTED: RNA-binding protein 7 [Vollenhovia emeryi]|uniref:RNA-binding protein 7 n=1 Tax=Vollenhovia emeryi TaxID=411798 RepID=UPI0005F4F365|nr:PREDICTED: RNA-binding protein 7 [Vollenhovia emeryi]
MDDDARTLYCGNLSEKVTEDILYELFLQGGPVQKITIPKDRDGKQRTFGFITYKHIRSVAYALDLFDGTTLYNRTLNMKLRNNTELQPVEQPSNPVRNMNHMLELGQQMILGNYLPQTNAMFGANISPDGPPYSRQLDISPGNDDRIRRNHPYQRNRDRKQERDRDRNQERDRNRERNRDRAREKDRGRNREQNHNDHHRDERSYYNRDNNYRSNDFRYNDNRKRWTYH